MRGIVFGGMVLALLPAPAAAQNECLKEFRMPAVGAWAEYTGVFQKDQPTTMRYAVVGSESREGKDMKWLELRMVGDQPDKAMVYQMLTPGSPGEMTEVREVVFKTGERPAMKMNAMMVGMIRGQLQKNSSLSNLCEGVTPAGEETVEVPAGSFKAVRLHNTKYDADTWVSSKVPFYMVKSKGKDFELSLVRSGDGAKSSITETPQEMPGMGPAKRPK
jgi:hypothetical protein